MKRSELKRRPSRRGDSSALRPKRCGVCGIQFQPTVGAQRYCGAVCRRESWMREFECRECGRTFRRERHAVAKFCSPACSNAATGRSRRGIRVGGPPPARFPEPAVCDGCGQKYMRKSRNVKYCSRSCHMTHRHAVARATAEPKWGIKSKGEATCRNCGRAASHLHHVVPRSRSRAGKADLRNGLPLCASCHYGWHHRTVALHHTLLTDDEFAAALGYAGGRWMELNYPDPDVTALRRLDEIVNKRRLYADRPESFDERVARVMGGWVTEPNPGMERAA